MTNANNQTNKAIIEAETTSRAYSEIKSKLVIKGYGVTSQQYFAEQQEKRQQPTK